MGNQERDRWDWDNITWGCWGKDPCEKVSSNGKSGKSQVGLGQHHMGVLGKGMGIVPVLSHPNFGTINHLARQGLVRGLRRLKFEKDHLCSACAMGKSKKKSHKPKFKVTNQEKLYLLHMDICGPMRVASVNGKKYILVGISHETFVARSSQQNGVVERRNRTLIKAARTINSQSTSETQPPVIHNDVEEGNHDIKVAHMGNDPYFGILIPKVPSEQSSSSDVIHKIMHPDHQIFEHNSKWTNDHPLDNIIGELASPVSIRLQLHEQALFCYYDAFLTSAKPKTYKDALTQSC
nr:Gag-Pol polyprotein [Tanacetum cinerariifolium]